MIDRGGKKSLEGGRGQPKLASKVTKVRRKGYWEGIRMRSDMKEIEA